MQEEYTIPSEGCSITIHPTNALDKFELGMGLSKVEKTWSEIGRVEDSVDSGTNQDIGRTV